MKLHTLLLAGFVAIGGCHAVVAQEKPAALERVVGQCGHVDDIDEMLETQHNEVVAMIAHTPDRSGYFALHLHKEGDTITVTHSDLNQLSCILLLGTDPVGYVHDEE